MSFPTGLVAILPLKNAVVYPGVSQALRVGRERSIKALKFAEEHGHWLITVTQKNPHKGVDSPEDLYSLGTLAKIESVQGAEASGYQIVVRGIKRVRLQNAEDRGYFLATPDPVDDFLDIDGPTQRALLKSLKDLSKEVLDLIPANTEALAESIQSMDDLSELGFLASAHADIELSIKQNILEISGLRERTMLVLSELQKLKENLKIQADIRQKLNSKFGQSHRQQVLREQLKAIKEELGESDEGSALGTQYRKKIEDAKMPPEAYELAQAQVKRLEEANTASPEHQVIRTHLDLMVSLPWSQSSPEKEIDLDEARKILDEDHYGLEKIKARILQHLAVMKMKKDLKGSILLFVGPPGVGKTSLGQSIARALGRKYVRVSVGGVRDDAEIRGHRRTYVGALPGRILQGVKKAKENNAVFVLDEIDKLSRGFSGDPASALLEVLDPEQNSQFLDHYLDTGFDLSQVLFVCTANSLDGIPGPLLDRMEVIEVHGYTQLEKFHMAKKYLWPKQLEEHGLNLTQVSLPDEALRKVISSYTREAGVRELQRKLAQVCRFSAEKVFKQNLFEVELSLLDEIFGAERYHPEVTEALSVPGVVTGMAWTPVGGDILFVESALMPGKGEQIITGQLGDVMKESAQIALSLLKTRMIFYKAPMDFSKFDFHIHVPAGAIPKDGPSAGVTLLTSLASLLLRRGVDPKLAMTGEITLRGAVMPVGGIKEKCLAAHRAGVVRIILPKKNQKDFREVPEEIKKDLQVFWVEHIHEVLKIALDLDLSMMEASAFAGPSIPLIEPPPVTHD